VRSCSGLLSSLGFLVLLVMGLRRLAATDRNAPQLKEAMRASLGAVDGNIPACVRLKGQQEPMRRVPKARSRQRLRMPGRTADLEHSAGPGAGAVL